jgi:hypothetical protein
VSPVVEADTGVVVDAKIIASVKIVAAAVVARYVLCSRGIFLLLLLFSVFILFASRNGKQRIKEFDQLTRKEHSKLSSMIRSNNVLASHRNIIKSFLVALKKPLALLQYLWVLPSSHPIRTV